MQGVIKAYDPGTGLGVVMCDTDLADYDLAADALEGSIFRMVRQGQRVVFDLDEAGRATRLRLGSEVDMGTPGRRRSRRSIGFGRSALADPSFRTEDPVARGIARSRRSFSNRSGHDRQDLPRQRSEECRTT